jgi:hypothetical protein
MSFFRFANKLVIYLDGTIPLAHARCTQLSQVIKSQNKIIYTVGEGQYLKWTCFTAKTGLVIL